MSLIHDLKERALFQWAAAYLAAAWLTLEVLGFLADNFYWSATVVRGVTIALSVGLLLVLVLAWHHGERGRQRVTGPELLLIAGILAIGGVLVAAFAPAGVPPSPVSPSRALLPRGEERRRSIAVLPFESLSADQENAFYADGVHESVVTELSTVRELRVLSRAAVMRYRETDRDLREIADELGAGTILRGSVQRAGDRIRVSAQLVDPASEENLWAAQFDGGLDELFDVQSAVASRVADRLADLLGTAGFDASLLPSTESAAAQEFYLRGRLAYGRLRSDDNEEAIRLFRLAIAEDSAFALAWAGLGSAYVQRRQRFGYPVAWTDSAEAAGHRAIALDSTLAEGYSSVGSAWFLRGRNAEAIRWFERALELNPGLPEAEARLAIANTFTGNWAEALRRAKHAFRLDPTSAGLRELLANAYQDLREFGVARRWLEEALARDARSPAVRRQQLAFEILRGEPEAGYRTLLDYIAESGEDDPFLSSVAANGAHYARDPEGVLAWTERAFEQAAGGALRDYHDLRVIRAFALSGEGRTPEANELLASAEQDYAGAVESGADSWLFPLYLSAIHLVRGSTEEGLVWLERADAAGFNGWNLLEVDPIFDIVRGDPRYRETIAAMRGRLEAYRVAIETEERAAGERPEGP